MTRWGKVDRHIRYVGGVAVASDMGNLNHTHSAQPMRGLLAALQDSARRRPTWWSPTMAGPAPPGRPA